jgi:hypothetical protein
MNAKLLEIALRRERLIAQAAQQRTVLVQSVQPLRAPLALADQGLVGLRYLKRHPAWVVGGVAVIVILRPRAVGKWLARVWLAWKMVRRLRGG